MWIFSFAPEWAIHLIFGLGLLGIITGFLLGFIPFIKQYSLPIKIISLLIFSLGLYLQGGLADYRVWEMKAKELEVKVKEAEKKALEKNVQIQEKIVTKTNTMYKKGDEIIKYIDREVSKKEEIVKYIENCPVPKEIIEQHNRAVNLMNEMEIDRK
jgi:hypothetical protein